MCQRGQDQLAPLPPHRARIGLPSSPPTQAPSRLYCSCQSSTVRRCAEQGGFLPNVHLRACGISAPSKSSNTNSRSASSPSIPWVALSHTAGSVRTSRARTASTSPLFQAWLLTTSLSTAASLIVSDTDEVATVTRAERRSSSETILLSQRMPSSRKAPARRSSAMPSSSASAVSDWASSAPC